MPANNHHAAVSWCCNPSTCEVIVQGMKQGANTRLQPSKASWYAPLFSHYLTFLLPYQCQCVCVQDVNI